MPLNASFANALNAAHDATSGQHYPQAALYIVATPIGNLADITLRALQLLNLADTIACEDTRHTAALLRGYGIDRGAARLLAVHQHNEAQASEEVVTRLRSGQRVAYVSDAGTPAISDPGARLVAAVAAGGLLVVPVPGASSLTAVLSVAGITDEQGFVFVGFPPSKAQERQSAVSQWALEPRAFVLLEAPHRIEALAQALAALGARRVTLARELTKRFENIVTLAAHDISGWLQADAHRLRGEFALVVHPQDMPTATGDELRVLRLLIAELPLKMAVRLTADITGSSRNALYEQALAWKADAG